MSLTDVPTDPSTDAHHGFRLSQGAVGLALVEAAAGAVPRPLL